MRFRLLAPALFIVASLGFPASGFGTPIFKENVTIFDGIGVAVAHLTHVMVGVSRDELGNGPPGGGGGAHGLVSIVFTINDVYKPYPFSFTGFILPAGWPSDAWIWNVVDPPGTDLFTVSANTAKYGDEYVIQTLDEVIGFSFGFAAYSELSGYPWTATFVGTDPSSPSFGELVDESGFHPANAPEPSTLALCLTAILLPLMHRKRLFTRA